MFCHLSCFIASNFLYFTAARINLRVISGKVQFIWNSCVENTINLQPIANVRFATIGSATNQHNQPASDQGLHVLKNSKKRKKGFLHLNFEQCTFRKLEDPDDLQLSMLQNWRGSVGKKHVTWQPMMTSKEVIFPSWELHLLEVIRSRQEQMKL